MMTSVIYLEQTPGENVKRVAGKHASRPFHIPMDEGGYTQEELTDAIDTLDQSGKIIFGGNFTESSWPDIRARVRYLAVSKRVKIVYLDHPTALIDSNNEHDRKHVAKGKSVSGRVVLVDHSTINKKT